MKILVSSSKTTFEGWVVVNSINDLLRYTQGVAEVIVLSDITVSSADMLKLSRFLPSCNADILYISSRPNNPLKMCVLGVGGSYSDDEFYLESPDTLECSVGLLREGSTLNADLRVVKNFLDNCDGYRSNLQKSLIHDSLVNLSKGLEESITEHKKLVSDNFKSYTSLLTEHMELRNSLLGMQETIAKLKAKVQTTSSGLLTNSVYFYPQVEYTGTKTIYKVKALTHIPYLLSFLMGFRDYLTLRSLRPKLVVVCPPGETYTSRYSGYPWVNSISDDVSGMMVFTNNPTSSIMDAIINHESSNTLIICDLASASMQHIIKGGSKTIYASSSKSFIDRLGIPRDRCISSGASIRGFRFSIPEIPQYPVGKDARKRAYEIYIKQYNSMMGVE